MATPRERAEKAYPDDGNYIDRALAKERRKDYERGFTDAMQQRTEVTDAMVEAFIDGYEAHRAKDAIAFGISLSVDPDGVRAALEAAVGDRLARAARMKAALKEVRAECIVVGREPTLDGDDARELIREITSILTEAGE